MEYKKLEYGEQEKWPDGIHIVDGQYFGWNSNEEPCKLRYAHQVGWMEFEQEPFPSKVCWKECKNPSAILWPPIDRVPAGITIFKEHINQIDSRGFHQGLCKGYYSHGGLFWEANYIDGVLNGLWNTWRDDGNICAKRIYVNEAIEGEEILYVY